MRSSRIRTIKPISVTLAVFAALQGLSGSLLAQTAQAPAENDEIVRLEKFQVEAIKEFSDQAVLGKTPISVSEVSKLKISEQLSSRDIPFAMESAPSFYVTSLGGGAGDARISVRGFNQNNISILINGVPTNDIENGWLYWSNWDAVGNVTQTIQLQRGLSYSTLPTPSVGGTLNIITDPASAQLGGSAQFEVGSDDFFKQTYVANTGLLGGKFAATVAVSAKKGDGFSQGNWTEAQGYYVGLSYQINTRNRVELYGILSPQRHGQNSYQQNVATYDHTFARKLGFTEAQLNVFTDQRHRYNQNYGAVNPSYTGQQYYWDGLHARQNDTGINQIENYYSKPQANVNWFFTVSDQLKLSTVAYYSGGDGGGSGTLGSLRKVTTSSPSSVAAYDWDATIAANAAAANGSLGILRNSVNKQDQYGIVEKVSYDFSDTLKFTAGVDWRTAQLDHYREVRDLLGGAYYVPTVSQWKYYYNPATNTNTSVSATQPRLGLGDKVDYYNSNQVDWLAGFMQAQYKKGPITAFATYGYSTVSYKYTNHFVLNTDGSERKIKASGLKGQQVKGGIQYALNPQWSVYANAGWISKMPIFDAALVDDDPGRAIAAPKNETFNAYEGGVRFTSADRKLNLNVGYYYTMWRDRLVVSTNETSYRSVTNNRTEPVTIYQRGINSNYGGVEAEASYAPSKYVRFDAALSINNWYYTADGVAEYFLADGARDKATAISLKGLKVGDAPQRQVALSTTVYPVTGLSVTANGRWFGRYYAKYTAESREADYAQGWRVPDYCVFDLHVNYDLPIAQKFKATLFLHLINVLDKTYIQDATDNYFTSSSSSLGSAVYTSNAFAPHTAQTAEINLGTERMYTAGLKIAF